MIHRSAKIVGCHLLVRLRELAMDRKRMWSVCTTALAFVVLLYTVADHLFSAGLGDALNMMAVRVVLHSVLALCIPIAVFLSIDALKQNGVWTRLSFYPVERTVLVFVVLGEAFLITTVADLQSGYTSVFDHTRGRGLIRWTQAHRPFAERSIWGGVRFVCSRFAGGSFGLGDCRRGCVGDRSARIP